MNPPKKLTEQDRTDARARFYHIVKERLDARIARGETYTTTADLAAGYEPLHAQGFSDSVTPGQSVMQVLGYAEYRGRVFYARDSVTHRAERAGAERYSPYKLYLRDDASVPQGYVLVPHETPTASLPAAIAAALGADGTVHHSEIPPVEPQEPQSAPVVPTDAPTLTSGLIEMLTGVIEAQAQALDAAFKALIEAADGASHHTPHPA